MTPNDIIKQLETIQHSYVETNWIRVYTNKSYKPETNIPEYTVYFFLYIPLEKIKFDGEIHATFAVLL